MASLPQEIKEQTASKTSVYRQGNLVYDGATGEYVGDEHGANAKRHGIGPGTSLNEMLKWSIENSDPAELERRAGAGASPPSQLDREILDMLMGEPIVAKMRSCLGKLEGPELRSLEGLDAACAALEELEYYAEDIDHSLDLVKIGGIAALRRCCAFGLLDGSESDEADAEAKLAASSSEDAAALREASCGVLAAMIQNNPKVERAASAAGVQTMLLALLSGGGVGASADRVGGVAVVQKALLALSALLRTCVDDPGEAVETPKEQTLAAAEAAIAATDAAAAAEAMGAAKMAAVDAALPTLCLLSAHPNLKMRRRTIFLLASLAAASPPAAAAIAAVAAARVVESAAAAAADGADGTATAAPPPDVSEGGGADAASPLLRGLIAGLQDADEDLRTQSARLLLSVRSSASAAGGDKACADALARKTAACGGAAAMRAAMQRAGEAAAAGEGSDPEESGRLKALLEWVEKA